MILCGLGALFCKDSTDAGKQSRCRTLLVIWLVLEILLGVIAVQIAARCNPNNPVGYGLLAVLFPEIYMLQFLIRKYVMKTPGYCDSLGTGSFSQNVFYPGSYPKVLFPGKCGVRYSVPVV